MLHFHIVWTIAMLAIFIAIVGWAFSARRRDDFAAAANLPLDQSDDAQIPDASESK